MPRCWRSFGSTSPASAALLIRSPEGRSSSPLARGILEVLHVWHSSSWLFGDMVRTSASASSSCTTTRPRGRRRHCLHRQRLCGSVIPAYGLQRYEYHILVSYLYISIAWVLGLVISCRKNFVFSASIPFSGIRARLCVDVSVRVERIARCGRRIYDYHP